MSNDRIYVCEWVKKDISFLVDNEEFSVLKTHDYTYHVTLEHAQHASSLLFEGYKLAKGKNELPILNLNCECIWIYEDCSALGRYVMQNNIWIYDSYSSQWMEDWNEMLIIPVPLQNTD